MMSDIFQFRNDSMEHLFGKDSKFSRHTESEADFRVNTANEKRDLPGQTNNLHTVLYRDAFGNERFRRSPSLRAPSDIENDDSDEEPGKAVAENFSSANSDEKRVISSQPNKEVEDEVDQLTSEFRNCIMKNIYSDSGFLRDGSTRAENGVKLTITMTVTNSTSAAVHKRSVSSSSSSHRSLDKGSKSFALERSNSLFEWGRGDKSMDHEISQNDFEQSKLPLPPRLQEASYRNPLRLNRNLSSTRSDSMDMGSVNSFEQLFSPREQPRKKVPSVLAKMLACWRPIVRKRSPIPSNPDCRYSAMV